MRDIKFRAWIIDEDKMIYAGCLDNPRNYYIRNDWKLFRIVKLSDKKWQNFLSIETKCEIMQYTWLKDKNGKEIYFWDILATSNQDKDYDIWGKEDYWYTVVEENIYELWIVYSKWHMTYDVESIYHFRFCEVIGNIYENPELLWNQSK